MATICTSCGVSIPSSMSLYKCRQCVHHFVCGLCEKKTHNRASAAFHTLDETLVPRVQPTTATSSNTSSKFANNQQQSQKQVSLIKATKDISLTLFMLIVNCRQLQNRHQYLPVNDISMVY